MKSRRHELDHQLEIFVIYERPLDFPESFVVRRWFNDQMTPDYELAPSLVEARKLVPPSADFRTPRCEGDDPCIVEMWF